MTLKVAILQKKSLDRQYQKSTDIIVEKMREAAENGADLLLLPEVFITGYELPMSNEEALPEDSPYLRQICVWWQQRSQKEAKSRGIRHMWSIRTERSF